MNTQDMVLEFYLKRNALIYCNQTSRGWEVNFTERKERKRKRRQRKGGKKKIKRRGKEEKIW